MKPNKQEKSNLQDKFEVTTEEQKNKVSAAVQRISYYGRWSYYGYYGQGQNQDKEVKARYAEDITCLTSYKQNLSLKNQI